MSNPDRDTIPAPDEPDVGGQIAELLLAMQNVGDQMSKLGTLMLRVQLAQHTNEHKLNIQREKLITHGRWLVDHERRLRVLEEAA